jgi:glycosyltransferase 2 family protein
MQDSTQQRSSWGLILKRSIKPILIVLVVLGIGKSVRLAWHDLSVTHSNAYHRMIALQQRLITASDSERHAIEEELSAIEKNQFSIGNIRWTMVGWSILFSIAAIIPPAIYWWLTLLNFEHAVPFFSTQSIFAVGNLGKYVPGKAMVLVLRSGPMQRLGVPISTSIVSIFIETLTSLAVGGALGALALATLKPATWLLTAAIGAAIVSLIPTIPPVFRRILVLLTSYRHLRLPKKLSTAMSWRLVGSGWLLLAVGWLCMGTSLWVLCEAIRQAIETSAKDAASIPIASLTLWWTCVASSCLGFVIGFLSMLPGGAGAREVVVTMLLAPAIGYAPALAAAVLYRISSLTGELLVAGISWTIAKMTMREDQS